MIRKFLSAFAAAGLLALGLTPASSANSDVDLSAAASAAFSDVGRCLVSTKDPKLSVLYLIDNSGSLAWTDPEKKRQEILEGSISELGTFVRQGIDVQVSAHFFSTGTGQAFGWTRVGEATEASRIAAQLGSQINSLEPSGSTDWEEGLSLAYRELQSTGDSCKMLIWLTDGGINPDNTTEGRNSSLAALCKPGVGAESLGTGKDFGLMSAFRKAQIPVFGVLYSNLDSALKYFKDKSPAAAADLLAQEKWLMSFMRPLVEGRGEVESQTFDGQTTVGGVLDCAEILDDGTAPPEQTNGAFLNAEDPVALAYQFMKLGTQISGGFGSRIVDGKFVVPAGTAKFVVLVAGQEWSLEGPEESGVQASFGNPTAAVKTRDSAGATSIEVETIANPGAFGEWEIDTGDAAAELFLYTGLTFTLDRDRSSKILSEYPNTITGRIIRTSEFEGYPIDLGNFPESAISVAISQGGNWVSLDGLEIQKEASGEFSIANFVPPANLENLGVRLRLGLGGQFSPVESDFELIVQDKNALARATTDNLQLSSLIGPDGVAQGILILEGPNTAPSSEFCFVDELRIEDTQSGIEKVERLDGFTWTFKNQNTGETGNCFTVALGENLPIEVSSTNPKQADSEVVSVWNISSKTEGVDALFEAPIRFSYRSEVVTNQAVTLGVLITLMLLGLLLPLLAMYLLNFLTTRFLDVENTVKTVFPVKINSSGAAPLISDARTDQAKPWAIGPRDFLFVEGQKAPKIIETGVGQARARIPGFPLSATWYEWAAPSGSRIITHNLSATKKSKAIKAHRAVEVSPNMAENWAIVVPDSELLKPDASEKTGQLVIFAPSGSISQYENRISKILNSPTLKANVQSAVAEARLMKPEKSTDGDKGQGAVSASPSESQATALPNIPGFGGTSAGGASGASTPTTSIPGFGPSAGSAPTTPPNIPGFGNTPGASGTNQKPPWQKD